MAPSQSSYHNGSPRMSAKSPPLSKFFQVSARPSTRDAGPTGSSESLNLSSSQRPVDRVQEPRRSESSQDMAPPGPPSSATTLPNPLRIGPHNPHDYLAMRGAQSSPLPPQKPATGTSKDGTKWGTQYGQSYGQGHDRRGKPTTAPRHLNLAHEGGNRSSPPVTPVPPEPKRKVSEDGYKLQPVAYSPNPQVDDDQQSWEEGDDGEAQRKFARPAKPSPEARKSSTPLLPPKLPLLYFEQDRVDQIDFAYQQPSRPSSRAHSRTQSRADTLKGLSMEDSPSKGHEGKQSPKRPSPPPIDTNHTFTGKNGQSKQEDGRTLHQEDADGSGDAERGNSFYWHSPESSASGDPESPRPFDKASEDDTKGELDKKPPQESLVIKPIVSTISENSLTSATALGFGGPSDWEHFGDYDAEEVDDIALYTSNKPKTAELPGTNSPNASQENEKKPEGVASPRKLAPGERDVLPTIQERISENIEDDPFVDKKALPSAHSGSDSSSGESSPAQASHAEDEIFSAKPATDERVGTPETPDQQDEGAEHESVGDRRSTPSSESDESQPTLQSEARRVESGQQQDPLDLAKEVPLADKADESHHDGYSTTDEDDTSPKDEDREKSQVDRTQANSIRSRVMSDNSLQSSQLGSPIDDDDGKENIIISLQVPGDNPAGGSTEQPRNKAQNLSVATDLVPKNLESPELLRTGRRSVFPQSIEMDDPYAGLDPWAKASLNRYVKMLREEAQGASDEEKFTTFINFAHKETHIRAVLYDMDDESDMSDHPVKRASVKSGRSRFGSFKSKSRPPVPPKNEPVPAVPSVHVQEIPVRSETMPNPSESADHSAQKSEPAKAPVVPATAPPQKSTFQPPGTSDESFVMVDSPAEDRSANKRNAKEKSAGPLKMASSLNSLKKVADIVTTRGLSGLSKDRTMAQPKSHERLAKEGTETKASGSPVSSEHLDSSRHDVDSDQGQSISESEKTGSKVYKYSEGEGRAYEGDKAENRQSIYRPFSGLLRQRSTRRGPTDSISEKPKHHDRLSSTHSLGRPFEETKPPIRPVNYRYTILEPLLVVIPPEGILHDQPDQLVRLRHTMDSVPDDFTFIHRTVLAWDAEAKKARERHEREREVRQSENEARIDHLFNENDIGYSDIQTLEAEFKRTEATKKAEEDREEVATFVASVFDTVWARINYEMDQLTPLYEECTALVSNSAAGRTMFEDAEERVPIAPAMEILLILYQKLMVRHQKAFEAVLERDRRLKKTEVAPWYAMGKIEQVKEIEKRFEFAEKKAILEFCQQRDERANLLMDVLDQNTLRGVGANQDYMESIMTAVRKIGAELTSPSSTVAAGSDDAVSADEVLKAQAITAALAMSSEQIVQTFHVADMLLNAADYEVSVANAKLSNADAVAFRRLREAKAKEDSKLAMDLEHRMSLIRGDTGRTQEEIVRLMELIARREPDWNGLGHGTGPGQGQAVVGANGGGGGGTEAGARDREAKRRNGR